MRHLPLPLLLTTTLVLSACQTVQGTRETSSPGTPAGKPAPNSAPAPATTPAPQGGGSQPLALPWPLGEAPSTQPQTAPPLVTPVPEPEVIAPLPNYPKTAEEVSGPAVVSLIKQARAARAANKPAQAQAALERAMRIEPRNAFVWSALASTFLAQNNYAQAMSHAQKSNSLARGNIYLELDNYRTIAIARDAQGDAAGSLAAQARVDEIQRLLQQAQPAP